MASTSDGQSADGPRGAQTPRGGQTPRRGQTPRGGQTPRVTGPDRTRTDFGPPAVSRNRSRSRSAGSLSGDSDESPLRHESPIMDVADMLCSLR